MPRPLPCDRWLAEAAERFAALDAWRQAHPQATWAEIETAIDAQLGPLRAQMLGETAMASAAATLSGERPVCAHCGERLQRAGPRQRRLRGERDIPIGLERAYAVVTGVSRACELAGGSRLERSAGKLRIVPAAAVVSADGDAADGHGRSDPSSLPDHSGGT